jgi:magnesium chelatase family protein
MKVQSLIEDNNQLKTVEVELTLWPGLPGIQFIGLPDQHLKESALRIKSAIKSCGFQFPVAQQILVNLRPNHLKKSSKGLELAIAAAYLWQSGQIQTPTFDSQFFVYGELTLSGEVLQPDNLSSQFYQSQAVVLTGENSGSKDLAPFRRQTIGCLKDLDRPREKPPDPDAFAFNRPQAGIHQFYTRSQARLLEILAVGEHSALIAGPAGSGKTTVGKALPSFMREPNSVQKENLRKNIQGPALDWRPFVKPHHTTPLISMMGGGASPRAGEIAQAHGGVLMMDELLEFSPAVHEALREPFEEGKMRVSRGGKVVEFPVESQILATTNLCPCGDWTPAKNKMINCRFSATRCRSYQQRLSGPFLDRFEILEFTKPIKKMEVSGEKLYQKISEAQNFSKIFFYKDVANGSFANSNSRRPFQEILKSVPAVILKLASSDEFTSQRRKIAILRVSRTRADLDLSSEVRSHHLDEAMIYCKDNFSRLQTLS